MELPHSPSSLMHIIGVFFSTSLLRIIIVFVFTHLHPKKPLCADKPEGCAAFSM